jgi:hypothetical protein
VDILVVGQGTVSQLYKLNHLQRRHYLSDRQLQGDERNNSSAANRKASRECPMIEELRDFATPHAVQRELCQNKLPRRGLRGRLVVGTGFLATNWRRMPSETASPLQAICSGAAH